MAWSVPRTWANGEIVTQTMLNTDVRDNMRELWHEVAYVEFTANVTCSGTEAAPTDIVSSGAITYVANPIMIEFFAPGASAATLTVLSLWDGATDLGRLKHASGAGSGSFDSPVYLGARLTPTAASHTYKIRGFGGGGVLAGAGGVGAVRPGYIRVMQRGG